MRIFSLLFSSLLLSHTALAGTPQNFDSAKWNQLVASVSFVGDAMNGGDYDYRTFASVNPKDASQPRKADYFSTVGVVDSNKKFTPVFVSAVSEDWSKNEQGNWVIDQWIWQVSLTGNLSGVSHTVLVETPTGSVLDVQNTPTGASDSAMELGRWGQKLAFWMDFKPFTKR